MYFIGTIEGLRYLRYRTSASSATGHPYEEVQGLEATHTGYEEPHILYDILYDILYADEHMFPNDNAGYRGFRRSMAHQN